MKYLLILLLLFCTFTLSGCSEDKTKEFGLRDYDGVMHEFKFSQSNLTGNLIQESFYDSFEEVQSAICGADTRIFPSEKLKYEDNS